MVATSRTVVDFTLETIALGGPVSEQHREGASRFLIWPSALRRPIETVDLLAAVDRKTAADARLAAYLEGLDPRMAAYVERTLAGIPPLTDEQCRQVAELLRPRPWDTPRETPG